MKSEIAHLLKSAVLCVIFCVSIAAGVAIMLRTPLFGRQKAFLFRLLFMAVLLIVNVILFLKKETIWGLSFSIYVVNIGLFTVLMMLFFSLGPMPIERSYTIYSLADMSDNSDVVYSAEDIKIQFIEGYIEGANESQKRIDEQVYIGNLKEVPGGYQITEKGKNLIKIFRVVEAIFPVPDKNSIYPNGK